MNIIFYIIVLHYIRQVYCGCYTNIDDYAV